VAKKSYLQMAFEDVQAKIVACNANPENHGDDLVVKTYVTIEFDTPNTDLAYLHPQLREAYYSRADTVDLAGEDHLPKLKFPQMQRPRAWDWKGAGYGLSFKIGATGHHYIKATAEKVDKITFLPLDGGTVRWKLRCVTDMEAAHRGRLQDYIKQKVPMDLLPPEDVPLTEEAPATTRKKRGKAAVGSALDATSDQPGTDEGAPGEVPAGVLAGAGQPAGAAVPA